VAEKARAKKLCLIHYPVSSDLSALADDAESVFSGEVFAAEDFMRLTFD
jgi:ribonuclease BN (tRNA processing enzyme)